MDEHAQKASADSLRTVAMSLKRAKLAGYVELMNNPWRLMWLNFLAGLARGVGIASCRKLRSSICLCSAM